MRDDASYKGQRRKDVAGNVDKARKAEEEGLFFGASPTQKKDLRQTKDKKTVDLGSLDMNAALDRKKLGAPEKKVGENLKLIDMAMGKDKPPSGVVRREVAERRADVKTRRQKKKHPPRKSLSSMLRLRLSKKARQQAAVEAAQAPKAAPDYAQQGVVVPRPGRLDKVLFLLGALAAAVAGGLTQVSGGALPAAELDAVLRWLSSTPAGALAALAPAFVLLGACVRVQRRPRGGFLAELVRALVLALLPTALGAGLLAWTLGEAGAPASLSGPIRDLLNPLAESTGVPALVLGAGPWALICLIVGLVVRSRKPRLGEA